MAQLSYHRWIQNFIIDNFSSEDSMRDYLSSNPSLLFEESTWVIPIKEEKHLPKSSINKQHGRADIILCRMPGDPSSYEKDKNKILSFSQIEFWIIELKKEEASYKNGFIQLLDYMTIVTTNSEIRNLIKEEIKRKVCKEFKIDNEQFTYEDDEQLKIYGSLVAPSFDLFSRYENIDELNIKDEYEKFYKNLFGKLKYKNTFNEGFTLLDLVYASSKIFSGFLLMKLIRFRRGDEIIVFSENILGSKSSAQVSRIDPIELFNQGLLKEDQVFFFKDHYGRLNKNVTCNVMNKRGPSHSLRLKIIKIENESKLKVPIKLSPSGYIFEEWSIPTSKTLTTKNCSVALHLLFNIFSNEDLHKLYWNFGENNFIRENDGKSLMEIKADYKSN